jgi:hypothetical protein
MAAAPGLATPMGVFFTPGRVSGQAAKKVGPLVTA